MQVVDFEIVDNDFLLEGEAEGLQYLLLQIQLACDREETFDSLDCVAQFQFAAIQHHQAQHGELFLQFLQQVGLAD